MLGYRGVLASHLAEEEAAPSATEEGRGRTGSLLGEEDMASSQEEEEGLDVLGGIEPPEDDDGVGRMDSVRWSED